MTAEATGTEGDEMLRQSAIVVKPIEFRTYEFRIMYLKLIESALEIHCCSAV